jgi:cysteine desulfurase / selenocysteine lyase
MNTATINGVINTPDTTFDVHKIREDFPILQQTVHGKPLVYLDNAATTQKPQAVLDCLNKYYSEQNANIHRGVHYLSQVATDLYEGAREDAQNLINAALMCELIFVRGATEAINLVATSLGRKYIKDGDEIIISYMEHHSNIVPWQILCEQKGAVLRVIPINDDGELIMEEYEKMLSPKTKVVAVTHMSNALGTINPIKKIIDMAHDVGAMTLIDGAQAVSHIPVDVRELDCDFYAFSGHKLYGPTGVGFLYGKAKLLKDMPPYQGGGDMIYSVSFERTIYNDLPHRFEAGTPNIAGGIGLGAAIEYVRSIGMENIAAHERELLEYGTQALSEIPELRIIGTAQHKSSVLSFVLDGIHPHDIGTILDMKGIAIRTGHHCAQPVMEHFGIPATARASLAFYNTKEEIDALADGIHSVIKMFS